MRTVIGIDIGGSTTKIVGFRSEDTKKMLFEPMFVRATDAITSVYGAFGKFTMENDIPLEKIDRVLMTGVGSSFIDKPIYSLKCEKISEFECVGRGGLYLTGLDDRGRLLFICRYYYADKISAIAKMLQAGERSVYRELAELREGLRVHLEKEGVLNE